ncbi:hypothetical protein [Paraburkholderia phenazinium]|uniref:hypothetical protein n=1 Tax=Paraburkholderia phenazinium TaxID=60549 RepID=UPI00158EDE3C|nr:hypothetical protein [Paraburkholderia phenazinium]
MKSSTSAFGQLHPLFPLGQVAATPGAIDVLDRTGTNVTTLLSRHQNGDFGSLCAADVRLNLEAIVVGLRILSCYEIGVLRERVWIITERDRSVSTVLLPGEY